MKKLLLAIFALVSLNAVATGDSLYTLASEKRGSSDLDKNISRVY